MQGVPHHMLDILDPDEPFNALTFKERAQQTIDDILSRGPSADGRPVAPGSMSTV